MLGASVNGNAAETLARETGIDTKTLESRLTSMDLAKDTERRVLTDKHVVIVDEASTVGTRDLERLLRHAAAAGAIVRLVGDPAQHSSVEAGGIFRALLDAYPNDSVALTQNRRQKGPEMEVVRQSLAQYRAGHVATAWETLAGDGRVQVTGDPNVLLNRLVCDWNDDRARHVASPDTVKRSSMMAESHLVREALNDRARIVLRDAGVLRGPDASIGVHNFAVGDEVICRHATKLAPKHDRDLKVRNGTRGVVVGFSGKPAHRNMIVDFEGGRGPIVVPYNELTRELRAGVEGIITHSYALTTHAAQGETFDTGRTLASEHVSREGLYVGLSRGQHDAVAYVPDDDAMLATLGQQRGEEQFLPVAAKTQRDLVDVIGRRLQNQGPEMLSVEVDPYAGEGHRAATRKICVNLTRHLPNILVIRSRSRRFVNGNGCYEAKPLHLRYRSSVTCSVTDLTAVVVSYGKGRSAKSRSTRNVTALHQTRCDHGDHTAPNRPNRAQQQHGNPSRSPSTHCTPSNLATRTRQHRYVNSEPTRRVPSPHSLILNQPLTMPR